MPDITMCTGEGCVLKEKCYRYRAYPTEHRQSFFSVAPFIQEDECDHFWDITEKEDNYYRIRPLKEIK